jgi:hypothetical protein
MPNVQWFPSHKNSMFLTMHKKILTSPQWKKSSLRGAQASAKYEAEGTEVGEEQICEEKSVIISRNNSSSYLSCCNKILCFFCISAIYLYSLCSAVGVMSSCVVLFTMSDGGFFWAFVHCSCQMLYVPEKYLTST